MWYLLQYSLVQSAEGHQRTEGDKFYLRELIKDNTQKIRSLPASKGMIGSLRGWESGWYPFRSKCMYVVQTKSGGNEEGKVGKWHKGEPGRTSQGVEI